MKRDGIDGMQAYIDSVNRITLLTHDEETELGNRCLAGDRDAADELVRRNLRLAVDWARKYRRYAPDHFEDMIGEANAGLVRAARSFDPSRGRFSTHAVAWIRQRITRHIIDHKTTVRVSECASRIRAKVLKGKGLTGSEARAWAVVGRHAIAAGRGYGVHRDDEQDGKSFLELVSSDPESDLDSEFTGWIESRLAALPPRSRSMVEERFFLGLQLDEIGERHGITGKRVQQVVESALMLMQSEMPDWMLGCGPYPVRAIVRPSDYSKIFRSLGRVAS